MVGRKTGVTVIIVLIAYGYNQNKKEPSPVVETTVGKLQGIVSTSRGGKLFYEFLGVPFAQPPVGELRFEAPQPVAPWPGVRDASTYGNECAQISLTTKAYAGDEDCLYLNIFSPMKEQSKLPVMVFFHGGAFVTGGSDAYRPSYFMDEDVLLVTVNYRLAALGFLNTMDEVVRGNMGLKDQVMALKWIQQNIKAFGGDPNSVTIFGESAGSSSVSFHVISPMSKGLFSKGIMQSGTAVSDWCVFPEPAKQAKRFASKFGCNNESSTEMIQCLKSLDSRTFVEAHTEVLVPLRDPITVFVPTVEAIKDKQTFLPEHPKTLIRSGNVNKVPVIAGVNSEEGLLTSAVIVGNETKLQQANDEYNFWAARLLYYEQDKTDVSAKIRKFYFGDVENIADATLFSNFTNLFSDRFFFRPLHMLASEYAKHAPVRLYYYAHKGKFGLARLLLSLQKPYLTPTINVIVDMLTWWIQENVMGMELEHPGVCHADELALFFDWPLSSFITEDSKEYEMSKELVRVWASFAKNEMPIHFKDVKWDAIDPKEKSLKYLQITSNPAIIKEPFEDRVKFWDSLGL